MKLVISISFLGLALFIYMFWLTGSHGHVRIRQHMTEDWMLAGGITLCLSISICFLVWWLLNKKRRMS
jgi:hypothetical protein